MIKLFNLFLKENKIKDLSDPSKLSIKFNAWVKALRNSRNKTIANEATKFQIRKWIVNGRVAVSSHW